MRFTMRRMMIAVALVSIVLAGCLEWIRLSRRRDVFNEIAAAHLQEEEFRLRSVRFVKEEVLSVLNASGIEEMMRREADAAAYHASMKQKYIRAANRPWWPVEPDPPPPDLAGLGRYLSERGEYALAFAAYEEAIIQSPRDYVGLKGFARLLATCPDTRRRDGKRAIKLATQACDIICRLDTGCVHTLAAAYAESGNFEVAANLEREAIGMLPKTSMNLENYRALLRVYEAKIPHRGGETAAGE
jgi:tetratricopeptide (TPR) repeat protein